MQCLVIVIHLPKVFEQSFVTVAGIMSEEYSRLGVVCGTLHVGPIGAPHFEIRIHEYDMHPCILRVFAEHFLPLDDDLAVLFGVHQVPERNSVIGVHNAQNLRKVTAFLAQNQEKSKKNAKSV